MRIGMFSDSYLPSQDGISYSIETFREELKKLGHEVYVIAPAPGFRYKERAPGIVRFPAVKGLFYDDYLTSVFFPPQALLRIKKLKLDIIHFHTPSQIGLLGAYYAMRNHIPLVSTYHTDLYEYVSHYPQVLPGTIALSLLAPVVFGGGLADFRRAIASVRPERNIDKWNKKLVVSGITMINNNCDYVIAPSVKIQKQMAGWGTQAPIRILPTGVDEITTNNQAISRYRKKYGLLPEHKVVLFVGRLGAEKNIELLIKAFDMVAAKDPLARLVVVGGNVHKPKLEQLAAAQKSASQIIFTGFIDHDKLGAAYQSAQVFAFPSRTDTQGLVLHEAASSGLPIVMIDKDVTEIVKDGKNGYFARNTVKDFAKKLELVLAVTDSSHTMQQVSRKLAAEYSGAKQAKKLEVLYQNVIAAHVKAKIPR